MVIAKYFLSVLWAAGAYAMMGANQEFLASALMLAHCYALISVLEGSK